LYFLPLLDSSGHKFTDEKLYPFLWIQEILAKTREGESMTIRHTTYGFDAKKFISNIRSIAYENSCFNSAVLHRHAQGVFKTLGSDHPVYGSVLAGLRIDEESFFLKDADDYQSHIDFLILLCKYLVPAPNLSQRVPMGYFVIQTAFPSLDWSESDIHAIIFGDPLETLVDLALPNTVDAFRKFPQECGWLSSERCAEIIPKVSELIEMLDKSSKCLYPALNALEAYATNRQSTPHGLLKGVLDDAHEMLQWSQTKQSDLFLSLEY
jgi:hypothetical protein